MKNRSISWSTKLERHEGIEKEGRRKKEYCFKSIRQTTEWVYQLDKQTNENSKRKVCGVVIRSWNLHTDDRSR